MSKAGTHYVAPGQYRQLRACMICSLVQTHSRFLKEGCPNCSDIIQLRNESEMIEGCTSPVFEGLITLRDPQRSWVARWQRIDKFVKGVYAVKVSGNLPEEVVRELEDNNVVYRPRDGSYVAED